MFVHRLRRWPNIEATLGECLLCAGMRVRSPDGIRTAGQCRVRSLDPRQLLTYYEWCRRRDTGNWGYDDAVLVSEVGRIPFSLTSYDISQASDWSRWSSRPIRRLRHNVICTRIRGLVRARPAPWWNSCLMGEVAVRHPHYKYNRSTQSTSQPPAQIHIVPTSSDRPLFSHCLVLALLCSVM